MKERLKTFFISLLVFLVLAEIALRIFGIALKPPPPFDTAQKDELLGWEPKADYVFEGELMNHLNKGDNMYEVSLSSTKHGFKEYETEPIDTLPNIFFLGDSYTQAVEVSNEETFYRKIQESLPCNLFAFGMSGYGNLQEFMVLDQHIDSIQPDLIVLQVCSNDFIDNFADLERVCNYSVGLRRPYLIKKDSVVYVTPLSGFEKFITSSKLLTLIRDIGRRIKDRFDTVGKKTGETQIAKLGEEFPLFAESVAVTDLLFKKFKFRVMPSKLVIFCTDVYPPQYRAMKRLCQKHGIRFLEKPLIEVNIAKKAGTRVFARDGYHWNKKGHELVAKGFLEEMGEIERVEW